MVWQRASSEVGTPRQKLNLGNLAVPQQQPRDAALPLACRALDRGIRPAGPGLNNGCRSEPESPQFYGVSP